MLTRGEEGTFYVFGPLAVLSATLLSTTPLGSGAVMWEKHHVVGDCHTSGREGLCDLGGNLSVHSSQRGHADHDSVGDSWLVGKLSLGIGVGVLHNLGTTVRRGSIQTRCVLRHWSSLARRLLR